MHSSSSQKTNIRVSTDMQSTNYTIKIQIQNKANVNWSDPQAVIQVSSNIGLSFETVRLNVNHSALILVGQKKINRHSVIQFDKSLFGQYSNKSVCNNFGNFFQSSQSSRSFQSS